MTDSNLLQLTRVREVTPGTTPVTPDMTRVRLTGESLDYQINTIRSEEIRPDRLTPDLIQVGAKVQGGFNVELSYGAFDNEIESAMCRVFTNTPEKLNLTSDSSITDAGTTTDTYVVDAGGTAFKAGHLVKASGFSTAANNKTAFKVASSTGTTVVGSGLSLSAETAPPAGARLKVIGFQGASGDLTAAANGIGSTALNFTTLGLTVGQWIKVGGTATGDKFATAAVNAWIRITAISATLLTCDNLPAGWATDAGTGKTIKVWFGDYVRTGTSKISHSYEKVFTGQSAPYYLLYTGCYVNTMTLNFAANQILTGSFDFLGFIAYGSLTSVDASPNVAPQNDVLNAVSNVGRVAIDGSLVTGPNYVQSATLTLNNNLREKTAIGTLGLVDVGFGDCMVSGNLSTYFGDKSILEKYLNNTATSFNAIVSKAGQAMIFTLPKIKFSSGPVTASGRNQDVTCNVAFDALLYTDGANATYQFQIDRVEYFE